MATNNFDDMFNQEKLIEDFVEYLIEEEAQNTYDCDKYDLLCNFVVNNYWGDLRKYFNYEDICDMSLIKYLSELNEKYNNTLLPCIFKSIEDKHKHINQSREILYQLVINTRLRESWTECVDKLIEKTIPIKELKIEEETVMKLCETEVPVRHLKNINTVD